MTFHRDAKLKEVTFYALFVIQSRYGEQDAITTLLGLTVRWKLGQQQVITQLYSNCELAITHLSLQLTPFQPHIIREVLMRVYF